MTKSNDEFKSVCSDRRPGIGEDDAHGRACKAGSDLYAGVARQIIQEQVSDGGDAVPWGDTARYTEMMLERSVADFIKNSEATQPTFFDRGIPDVLCYARLIGLPVDGIRSACDEYRYHRTVFIAPPWEEIYATDSERKQTWAEAIETYRVMSETHRDCGYELVELPRAAMEARAAFIFQRLQLWN